MDYGFVHNDKVFTPNGTAGLLPDTTEARNRAIEAEELVQIARHPAVLPMLYYNFPHEKRGGPYRGTFLPVLAGAAVTTWLGTHVGAITSANVYRHNFGSRMVTIRANVGGYIYHGRASYDRGNCIRLRRTT